MGPTALLPLRRKAHWGFFCPKNPTASSGFEPANLGAKGQHATSRPPKPLLRSIRLRKYRMYLKYLNKFPEWAPHSKIRKTFTSIYTRKHWVLAVEPQSPNLNLLDFYLSGTLHQSNLNAVQNIRNLPRTFESLWHSMIRRVSTCWWRTFWAFAVNFDLINSKTLVVIKQGTCVINVNLK